MNCRYCGAPLDPGVKFCSTCGRSQDETVPGAASPPPPPIADVTAQTGRWISAGWDLIKGDWMPFVLMALVFLVVTGCIPLVLNGPLMAGFHIACIRKMMSGRAEVGDLFKAFTYFGATLLAFLVITVFTFLGLLLCFIPGLVVAAMYLFTYLFIVDKKMDFWPAMQASHDLVRKDYFGFSLFLLTLLLINVVGALACFVGVLVTLPLSHGAITAAYRDLVGFENKENF
jgi:zinc-ribbon domain